MAAAVGSASPASSPRLPSPPPFAELQLPPQSPGMPATTVPENVGSAKDGPQPLRRIRPGTRAADISSGPQLVPLSDLQEHLKSLHTYHTRSSTSPDTLQPISHATAIEIATPPSNVERSLWLYELTRFLVMRANDLIVSFFRESPPCSAATCPEMRASEWQYLCAVHEPPKPCCAIDYSCHTLDWAAYILTSQKQFPSRLTPLTGDEGLEGGAAQQQHQQRGGGVRQLTNIMRRVYRIFAHAWFQHRGVFWEVEGREGLYILFKTVCDMYGLIPEENYTIPKEAEGTVESEGSENSEKLKDIVRRSSPEKGGKLEDSLPVDEDRVNLSTGSTGAGATQRRHKATPSVGSSVATIQEGDEEDKADPSSKDSGETPTNTTPSVPLGSSGDGDTTQILAKPESASDGPADVQPVDSVPPVSDAPGPASGGDGHALTKKPSVESVATIVKMESADDSQAAQ